MQVIFDVDGTLLDIEHRLHHIKKSPKDWDSFRDPKLKRLDKPIRPMLDLFSALWFGGHTVIIASGRTKSEADDTRRSIRSYLGSEFVTELDADEKYAVPGYFRSDKDFRKDTIVKAEMLNKMRDDGYRPTLVFDDRPSVIRMWRDLGLKVADVGYGKEF